tara:strand:+ start:178 stop:1062 length:885 start_codon:yes stop_codon:yes gene_type:complete
MTHLKLEEIKVSTKTIIAIANISIDINKLYDFLPVEKYILIKKKRGRKKKIQVNDPNADIKEGSIILMKYQDKYKGILLKKPKKTARKKKYFRNALTIVMILKNSDNTNKLINFKISKNGKFQITGCKNILHAHCVIKYMWDLIKDTVDLYELKDPSFKVVFNTVMTNIDFNLGFLINRENLDKYINRNTDYNSLLETSFGYTGVNIKIPFELDKDKIKLSQLVYKENKWVKSLIEPGDYINKKKPKYYNTFLVFHSGNIIMSGMRKEFMKDSFEFFLKIIDECKDYIKEKLDI